MNDPTRTAPAQAGDLDRPPGPAGVPASQPHASFREHTVQISGGNLYYRTQGAGPVLVLIGGGPSNADTLAALAAAADPAAGTALNAIAASIGVKRALPAGAPAARPEIRAADVELFIRRDVPAVGDFQLDPGQLSPLSGRVAVTGSEDGRAFYPYQCAQRLAGLLGTPLAELPGNHAGMIQYPGRFARALEAQLPH